MGVNSCMSVRPVRGACHCPACPRALHSAPMLPPQTLVLPPLALEPETTPTKDKKGSKMKVLKKIKKKIGLAPRPAACTGGAPNNLPPLSFHRVHGENVRISRDGATAKRVESFCKGIAFSSRPVRVNEKVCLRFVEMSNNWSGVLRFGFTSHNPDGLSHCLPKYACPDLTNKPGNWAKALGERFCEKDNVLHYHVNSAGDVHFGVNGEDKGVFFGGVDVRYPMWALVDVYGNCTAVQFTDPRAPSQRRSLPAATETEEITESMSALSVDEPLPPPRYQSQAVVPLTLHRTKGRNVQLISDRGVAARVEAEFCQGYVFTARPMRPGQTLVVQILGTEPAYAGSLSIGLTSCDPGTLRPSDLPDDAEQLLDRPEYWVVRKDAANGLRGGDELSVNLTLNGEVRVSRNGTPITVMHVDHSLRLWAFVDIYGATQKVRLLSTQSPPPQVSQVQGPSQVISRVQIAGTSTPIQTAAGGTVLVVSLPPQGGAQNLANHQQGLTLASAHYIEPIQSSSQLCLTGLATQPPMPTQPQSICMGNLAQPGYPQANQIAQCSSSTQNNSNQQTLAELQIPINGHSEPLRLTNDRLMNGLPSTSHSNQPHSSQNHQNHLNHIGPLTVASSSHHQPIYSVIGDLPNNGLTGTECTICYEYPIDSVLYMCGHMCMCYRCAVQQWRGKGGGQCPLCRAQIKDVIRTYKS